MRKFKKLLKLNLQLFAEGGAAAGGEGGDAGTAQGTQSALPKADESPAKRAFRGEKDAQGSDMDARRSAGRNGTDFARTRTGGSRRSRSGELSNVVYGKQEDASEAGTAGSDAGSTGEGNASQSGVSTTSDTLEAKRRAFEELIDGEYRDQYAEKFQDAFNRRYNREIRANREALNAQKPIMDMLMQRYKIEDGDMGKLQAAIEDDNQYWESAAEEAGLTVEQYKAMKKLERENEAFKRMRDLQQSRDNMNRQLAEWSRQEKAMKELYPSFNLKAEAQNPDFLKLLRTGYSMKDTYEMVHRRELAELSARAAAQTAGAQMEARIKAKASRPAENGTSSQSAAIVKNDVHQLTRSDRAEIARLATRGKRITF